MTQEELSQAIKEFKEVYKKVFGVEISNEEATIQAQSLLQLFDCLLGEKSVQ